MKKLLLLGVVAIMLILSSTSCTKNQRAKRFGGTVKIELDSGKEFMNATWKDDELWYLVRDRPAGEKPETFELIEESSFGLIEGKVLFIEK